MAKIKIIFALTIIVLFASCVAVPKETVLLSRTIGNDLVALHNSHRHAVELYFSKIKNDINKFVDDVFMPYIVHFYLNVELQNYQRGDSSIFMSIELAAKNKDKLDAKLAIQDTKDFLDETQFQVDSLRRTLLSPVVDQEQKSLAAVDNSYSNIIYANTRITGYLESARKIKEIQQEAISRAGLSGLDSTIFRSLVKMSDFFDKALKEARNIDVKSDDALKEITDITNEFKDIITKN